MKAFVSSITRAGFLTVFLVSTNTLAQEATSDHKEGVAYFLPRARLILEAHWTLTCEQKEEYAAYVDVEAAVSSRFEPDFDAKFVVPTKQLRAALKDTDTTFTFGAGGTLQALNATAIDRTGEVIAGVLGEVAKIALVAAGAPTTASDTRQLPKRMQCGPDTKSLTDRLSAARKVLGETREKLRAARFSGAELKPGSKAHEGILESIAQLEKELSYRDAVVKKLAAAFSFTQTCSIAPTRTAFSSRGKEDTTITTDCLVPKSVLGAWLGDAAEDAASNLKLTTKISVSNALLDSGTGSTPNTGKDAVFHYRQPVPVIVTVTRPGAMEPIAMGDAILPQLGAYYSLPLIVSNWFSSSTIEASFSDSGIPTKIRYASPSEAAKSATAFAQSVDTVTKYVDLRRGEEAANLKREIDLLDLKKKKADAQKALRESEQSLQASD